jgi:hypothetical protein
VCSPWDFDQAGTLIREALHESRRFLEVRRAARLPAIAAGEALGLRG